MNLCRVIVMLLLAVSPSGAASKQKPLGGIDFYGYKGLDVDAIRSALPFHEGNPFPPANVKHSDDLKQLVSASVKRAIGREPTQVSFGCCDLKGNWNVYIGLPGQSYQTLAFNPAPVGEIRLPVTAVALRKEMDKAWWNAVMKRHATEDDSEGFTLTNDPKARRAELALRDYALRNETL